MNTFFSAMYTRAHEYNSRNIFGMLEKNTDAKLLDLGCFDGSLTVKLGASAGTRHLYGVDIVPSAIRKANKRGVSAKKGDLNAKLPFPAGFFDVVHANQVIEHVHASDMFLSETYRILKPGGYAVISTENASSWVNIAASVFGWQIFSLTNMSARRWGIGNPLALYRGTKPEFSSFVHIRIYNFYGLKEYLEVMGFRVERIAGAGYFPFPYWFGAWDNIHAHFMTFKVRKPLKK